MSITGHTDIREIERYCREAARKKLAVAAMTKLEGGFDIRLPNPPDELGNSDDNLLKSLTAKAAWRSQQNNHFQANYALTLAHLANRRCCTKSAFFQIGSPVRLRHALAAALTLFDAASFAQRAADTGDPPDKRRRPPTANRRARVRIVIWQLQLQFTRTPAWLQAVSCYVERRA
ncbi:hypothetical protein ABIF69_007551 [Bradyrhizobium japonicum]